MKRAMTAAATGLLLTSALLASAAPAHADVAITTNYLSPAQMLAAAPSPDVAAAVSALAVDVTPTDATALLSALPSPLGSNAVRAVMATASELYVVQASVDSPTSASMVDYEIDRVTGAVTTIATSSATSNGSTVTSSATGADGSTAESVVPATTDCTACTLTGDAAGTWGSIAYCGAGGFVTEFICGSVAAGGGNVADTICSEFTGCQSQPPPALVPMDEVCYTNYCDLEMVIRNESRQLTSLGDTVYWYYPDGFKGNLSDGTAAVEWQDTTSAPLTPTGNVNGNDTYQWRMYSAQPAFVNCADRVSVSVSAVWSDGQFKTTGPRDSAKAAAPAVDCPGFGANNLP